MKVIVLLLAVFTLCSCVTRNKVFFNKTTGSRWVSVDNPSEFLTDSELQFLGERKSSMPSIKK